MEIYKTHRPKTLREIIGQESAVRTLDKLLAGEFPHALMLTGPSGCGKTSIARILKKHLGCEDRDFSEQNCADFRGIEDIREIRRRTSLAPLGGRSRIWLIDECHKLSNDAQNAMLKMLEDTPSHCYFFLATTDPNKVIRTVRNRCTLIKLNTIKAPLLERLVTEIARKEGLKVDKGIVSGIVDLAEGSARKALVLLEQIGVMETEQEQLDGLETASVNQDQVIELSRLLLRGGDWAAVAKLLRGLEDGDVEAIRYQILGYMRACMLGKEDKRPDPKTAARAYVVLDRFTKHFWDSKHPGLAAACWEVVHGL